MWEAVAALSGAVSASVVVAGALYAHLQLREARLSRNASLLLDIRDRYHTPESREVRRRLLAGDFGAPQTLNVDALPPSDFHAFWDLLDQLELVGLLVERRLLDVDLVTSVFHRSPPRIWQAVEPYIRARRREVPNEGRYFELLARRFVQS